MQNIFQKFIKSRRTSNIKPKDTPIDSNPWAGLASYEDPETSGSNLAFCGREDESYDLVKLIRNNLIVTLYGRSGIGKTSVLNAGVFPELRLLNFHPINIRLGETKNSRDTPKAVKVVEWSVVVHQCETLSIQERIIKALQNSIYKIQEINVIKAQDNFKAPDFLWNYFARHKFFNNEGKSLIPVLVLDQFEELYNSDRVEVESLLKQLDFINDKDHFLDISEIDGEKYQYEYNFRFVLAIREDDLYKLEDSLSNCYLPALRRSRYRLRGLSEKGAKDVILLPCKGFSIFDNESEQAIVEKIISICRGENKNVNTLMLSLLCFVLYNECISQNKIIHIEDLEGYKNVIQDYYVSVVKKIPEKQRKYLEDNLVDEHGRRKTIYLSDLQKNAPDAVEFTKSSNSRLLNKRDNEVELIHDQLAAIISQLRLQRYEDQRLRSIGLSLFIYYIVAAYCIWKIILNILHASWAYKSATNALEYIIDRLQGIPIKDISVRNLDLAILSEIGCNIVLIYLIGYSVPKSICEYFNRTLGFIKLICILCGILILLFMTSNWIFQMIIDTNSLLAPIIGWFILLAIFFTSLKKHEQ